MFTNKMFLAAGSHKPEEFTDETIRRVARDGQSEVAARHKRMKPDGYISITSKFERSPLLMTRMRFGPLCKCSSAACPLIEIFLGDWLLNPKGGVMTVPLTSICG